MVDMPTSSIEEVYGRTIGISIVLRGGVPRAVSATMCASSDRRDFRFAVIDEAFGRGSDASTRYALELFAKLGLQLLIVTPLQKVHVIEP
jgi:uncharacterized protein YPO0396